MAWNGELTLDEMLSDPIVRLLMQRDGVSEGEVRAVMSGASGRSCPVPDKSSSWTERSQSA